MEVSLQTRCRWVEQRRQHTEAARLNTLTTSTSKSWGNPNEEVTPNTATTISKRNFERVAYNITQKGAFTQRYIRENKITTKVKKNLATYSGVVWACKPQLTLLWLHSWLDLKQTTWLKYYSWWSRGLEYRKLFCEMRPRSSPAKK